MHVTTPPGNPGTDTRNDPTGRHGDVDVNGDLVDCARVVRLRSAINAANDDLADEQLRAVHRMLSRDLLPAA